MYTKYANRYVASKFNSNRLIYLFQRQPQLDFTSLQSVYRDARTTHLSGSFTIKPFNGIVFDPVRVYVAEHL